MAAGASGLSNSGDRATYDALLVVGDNGNGQLGFSIDEVTEKTTATVANVSIRKSCLLAIASGSMHAAALVRRSKNILLTAGCGDDGQLGRPIRPESDAEASFQSASIRGLDEGEEITAISCSDNATFALSSHGKLYATGAFRDRNGRFRLTKNEERRLEFAHLQISTTSIDRGGHSPLDKSVRLAEVATGGNFALLLTMDGDVLSFGVGECGELGRLPVSERLRNRVPNSSLFEASPILVPSGTKFDRVFAGEFTAFARVDLARSSDRVRKALLKDRLQDLGVKRRKIQQENAKTSATSRSKQNNKGIPVTSKDRAAKAGSILYVFGLNNRGQLAVEYPLEEIHKPMAIHFPFEVEKVAGGQHHTLFLDSNGVVHAVGRPEYGRLGLGSIDRDVIGMPRRIDKLPYDEKGRCIDIAATIENSFAVMRDGSTYSFGAPNSILGLGYSNDDDHDPELLPVQMRSEALDEFVVAKVCAGSQHAIFAARRRTK